MALAARLGESVQRAELVSREHYGGTLSGVIVGRIVGTLQEIGNIHAAESEGAKVRNRCGDILPGLLQLGKFYGIRAQRFQTLFSLQAFEVFGGLRRSPSARCP